MFGVFEEVVKENEFICLFNFEICFLFIFF